MFFGMITSNCPFFLGGVGTGDDLGVKAFIALIEKQRKTFIISSILSTNEFEQQRVAVRTVWHPYCYVNLVDVTKQIRGVNH